MIGYYSVSAIGTDHLDKPDGVCQDWSDVVQLDNGYTVAVIADGLGSASRSDIGAKTAVRAVLAYTAKNIGSRQSDEHYIGLLEKAYMYAYNSVIQAAEDLGEKPNELNTTLAAAIYDGSTLYYGQCGDGGIIALTYEGEYVCVTSVKKGEAFNETFPLLGGRANWSFGKYGGRVCAVTMMTDGIFDIVCHPLLASQQQKINIPFIRRFMDRNILRANNAADMEQLQTGIERFVRGSGLPGVTDDKTIVGLINTEIMPQLKDDDYYKEPDWDSLNDNMKRMLKEKVTPINAEIPVTASAEKDSGRPVHDEGDLREISRLREICARQEKDIALLRKAAAVLLGVVLVLVAALCISLAHGKSSGKKGSSSKASVTTSEKSGIRKKTTAESKTPKKEKKSRSEETSAKETTVPPQTSAETEPAPATEQQTQPEQVQPPQEDQPQEGTVDE